MRGTGSINNDNGFVVAQCLSGSSVLQALRAWLPLRRSSATVVHRLSFRVPGGQPST